MSKSTENKGKYTLTAERVTELEARITTTVTSLNATYGSGTFGPASEPGTHGYVGITDEQAKSDGKRGDIAIVVTKAIEKDGAVILRPGGYRQMLNVAEVPELGHRSGFKNEAVGYGRAVVNVITGNQSVGVSGSKGRGVAALFFGVGAICGAAIAKAFSKNGDTIVVDGKGRVHSLNDKRAERLTKRDNEAVQIDKDRLTYLAKADHPDEEVQQ